MLKVLYNRRSIRSNPSRDSSRKLHSFLWYRAAVVSSLALSALLVGHAQTNYIEESGGFLSFPSDSNGYKIPDFSHAGYMGSDEELPTHGVEYGTQISLTNPTGDETTRIQNAINTVSALSPNGHGYRGAVVLSAGTWNFSDMLTVNTSGVVIRGAGMDETILQFTENYVNRGLHVGGPSTTAAPSTLWTSGRDGTQWNIETAVVDVGDTSFDVEAGHTLEIGDPIIIEHPGTAAWVTAVDGGGVADDPPWEADTVAVRYYRYVTSVSGNTITVDAPIMYSLVKATTQCFVYEYTKTTTQLVGLEDFTLDMDLNTNTLQDRSHHGMRFFHTENSWLRNVRVKNFREAGFAVVESSRITYLNCESIDPHSPIIASRRYNYNTHGGQLILYRDCYGRRGRHVFIGNGYGMDSGNVVVNGIAEDLYGPSEFGHQRWATGSLFDGCLFRNVGSPELGVGGEDLHNDMFWLGNHHDNGPSHGWASVTAVAYKCIIESPGSGVVQKPPTGMNYEIDCVGDWRSEKGGFDFPGSLDTPTLGTMPASLFDAQLAQRLGNSIGPKWLISDSSIDFGYQVTNSATDVVVSFTNNSENPQSGSVSVDSLDYAIVTGASFSALAVGATHDVTLRYAPTVAAKHTATLSLVDGDTVQIPIVGIAMLLQPSQSFDVDTGTLLGAMNVGAGFISTDTRDQGTAIYAINIGSAGIYQIDTSVNSPIAGSNSFFVAIDSHPSADREVWDILPLTSGFESRSVTHRGLNGTFDNPEFSPATWMLSEGVHYLVIQGREADTQLRDITLTQVNSGAAPNSPGPLDLQQ